MRYWLGHFKRWFGWCLQEKALVPWCLGHLETNKGVQKWWSSMTEEERLEVESYGRLDSAKGDQVP